MFDAQLGAEQVELMRPGRGPCAAGEEPVGELFSVVSQYLGDPNGAGPVQIAQEPAGVGGGLGRQDACETPPCGAVDGRKEIAARGLIRYSLPGG